MPGTFDCEDRSSNPRGVGLQVTGTDRQLPQSTLYVALAQGAFLVTGYIVHALLARWLEPALYGVFGVSMTILVWVEITVNNGVPSALQKFLPDASLSERSVLRAAGRCQLLISVGVFLVMFLASPWLAALLRDSTLTGYLRLAFVDILAMGAYAYYRGVLNGWRAFRQLSVAITAYSVAKLAAICLLVYLGFGVQGALVGNVVSSLGGLAAGYFWIRRRKRQVEHAARVNDAGTTTVSAALSERSMMAFVLPTALFTLASNLLLGMDLMGVKALLGDANQAGFYNAAVNLANAPRLVLLAFSFTLLPSLSHSIATRDLAQTRKTLQQTLRLLALVLFPILALVMGTAQAAIVFVFSAAYKPAAPILMILIFAYAAYTVYITLVTTLLAENRPGRALAIPLVLLPVMVGAVWVGVSRLGTVGAALATLCTVTAGAAVVTAYVFRRFRPGTDVLGRSLGRIALASAAVWFVAWRWSPGGLMLILAYGLLGTFYLGLLLALGELRIEDLALVATWLPLTKRNKGV
jgi:O-antigen/teichoic acid export membrane protein